MQHQQTYRLVQCPRYEGGYAEERIEENLRVQASFWNAIRLAMRCQTNEACVELRFSAQPNDRRVHVDLIVRSSSPNSFIQNEVLERLLPHDYQWQPFNNDIPKEWRWRAVRLVRRVEFFNLPDRTGRWMALGEENAQGGEPDASLANVSLANQQVAWSAFGDQRFMPEYHSTDIGRQLRNGTMCVPLLGSLCDFAPDRNRLCVELQRAAPAVLSIALHPIEGRNLADDRIRADFLRHWIEPITRQVAHSEFAMIRDLLPNFDRYWLSNDRLCNVTVRVGAAQEGDAHAIAHWMASQLGGMPVFEVIPIEREYNDVNDLALPSDGSLGDRFNEWLFANGVESSESYTAFLRRMPHIYTLEEAQKLLQLPYAREAGLAGMDTQLVPPFFPPSNRVAEDEVRIGVVDSRSIQSGIADSQETWHSIPYRDITKHALIVGSTGSGKSVTTQSLLREYDRQGVNFLVIEPVKTEYYDRLVCQPALSMPLQRYGFEGEPNGKDGPRYLIFDPMRLQNGVSVNRHVSYLKSCFTAAFPMSDVLGLILGNGLHAYYTDAIERGGCGMSPLQRGGLNSTRILEDGQVFPSFKTFSKYFIDLYLPEALDSKNRTEFSMDAYNAFKRRFESLNSGPLGIAFDRANRYLLDRHEVDRSAWNPFELLLQNHVVLELDAVSDNEEKSLVMAFVLTFLFEKRQGMAVLNRENASPGESSDPAKNVEHVVVVEEAHRLLSCATQNQLGNGESVNTGKSVSLFVDMLAEIRAFGQGLAIVEQIPTKIVPEALKNTNLKIMHRLTAEDDREYLGAAMNFNDEQKRFVTSLRTGQCVVFDGELDQPVLLRVPYSDQRSATED